MTESKVKNDLTVGSVSRQLVKYAIPFVLTSILQSIYGMVDMYIAGEFIGPSGISAISNSSQIVEIMTKIAIGLSLGGNIVISQYFGSKDTKNYKESMGTFITLFIALGVLFTIVFYSCAYPMLSAMKAPAIDEAFVYLRVTSVGIIFIMCYNAFAAILRALGNSKSPFHFVLIATIVNIILDYVFVGMLSMGTGGAALATVIAQFVSCMLALIYIIKQKDIFIFTVKNLKIKMNKLKMILKIGTPCAIQMTIAGVSWMTVTFLINQYGVDVSAGAGISTKIRDFATLFIHAMSSAASTMIAQNLGAGKYDRSLEVMKVAMKISLLVSLGIIIIVEISAPLLVGIFTDSPETLNAGVLNLRIEIVGQLFYAMFLMYHALMTGAGHTWMVFTSSFVNCILVRVVLAVWFNSMFGIVGVYVACLIAPSSSVPIGHFYTKSNVWRTKLVGSKDD